MNLVRAARAVLPGAVAAALVAAPAASRAANTAMPSGGDYLSASVALENNDFDYAAEHMLRALAADPRNGAVKAKAFLASALAGRPEAARLATGLGNDGAASLLAANALALGGQWDEAAHAFGSATSDGGLVDVLRPMLVAWSEFGAGHPDLALGNLAPLLNGPRLPALYALQAGLIDELAGRADDAAAAYGIVRTGSDGLGLDTIRILASFAARHDRLGQAEASVHALAIANPSLALAEAGIDASLETPPVIDARAGLADSYLAVASLLATGGHADTGALLMLRFALDLDPGNTAARLLASDIDQSLHVPQAGLAVLAPVRAADPLDALVQLRVAELALANGDRARARSILVSLTEAAPGVAEPWRELGELLSDDKNDAEAVAAFDHAIADTPKGQDGSWQLNFDRAVVLDRTHQWPRAEADLDEALRLSPDQPYVLNYLGYSYAEHDTDLARARDLVERALRAKPKDPAFLDSLGWIMLKQNDVSGGVRTLEQAAEMTPLDPTVNYHLGVGYWREGRHAEAADQWQQALILKPDDTDRPHIEARLRQADAEAVAGHHGP